MKEILQKFASDAPLTHEEIQTGFEAVLEREVQDEDISSFLRSLQKRGEDVELLVGAALTLRKYAIPVSLKIPNAIDTCGTGGDQSGSFNFSTAAGLLLAACGVPVAKHGNRAITSKAGSADLLEALKIPIDLGSDEVAHSVQQNHFGFMMAPLFHPMTFRVQKMRRSLGGVTIFNYLGPLLNPARVERQVVGVFALEKREMMAEALLRLGSKKVWVISGESGLDEMDLSGKTLVLVATPHHQEQHLFYPEDAGLKPCSMNDLKGKEAKDNAELLERIFLNQEKGAILDGILYNAAAGLCLSDRVADLKEGVKVAREALESGAAWDLLERLRKK